MSDIVASNARATIILDVRRDGRTVHDIRIAGENITIIPGSNGEARVSMNIRFPDEIMEA